LSNLANRQTDRQTDKRGQKHLPPPLSSVMSLQHNQTIALITAHVSHVLSHSAMLERGLAIGGVSVCPSVRLSVCPTHAGIESKLMI